MDERRQSPRYPVAWSIRLWLNEKSFLAGRTVDASVHGTWVNLTWLPTGILKLGETYRLQISPGTADELNCIAVVRHVSRHGVGLEIRERLPVTWVSRDSSRAVVPPD